MTNHEVPPLLGQIAHAVSGAIDRARPELAGAAPVVRRSEHADFQSNAALALAKRARTAPRGLAAELIAHLGDSAIGAAELSGPGFLNLTVPDEAIWRQVSSRLNDARLGVGVPNAGQRTVIDYSGPNIAKEMHVGHLRTTIIGDSLARVLEFLGAEVVRQNHLGDWGTQFGMLIQYLGEHPELTWHHGEVTGRSTSAVSVLDAVYKAARRQFDADPDFADRSRARVVALQSGDAATLAMWREIVAESEKAFRDIYDRLDVLITPEDSVGESFYNHLLDGTVTELVDAGIAVESEGALVIFSEEVTGPDGEPVPLMVRKRDGGYGYDTTDLAAVRYRTGELNAERLLYVTDSRQALHFRLIFEAARRAGWLTDDVPAEHVAFGTVRGPDGRPFKTREGGTVRLMALLDDAVTRARAVVAEKDPDLDPAELTRIAEVAGVGAVKYADLSTSRVKDYLLDVDRMVSFTGNTGVYLQYAHTRIRSILRKAGNAEVSVDPRVRLEPAERALTLGLDDYGTTLAEVSDTLEPHHLCAYLYALARDFTTFYETCPVLTADEPVRRNRLALCRLTARTLEHGLGLLGITAPERM
ncbi:arginine--tRNA ligase [Phytoactinopolyspora halotolerans]|uniref:Arginine--tRNA ligase n=1 Tax=Phytoactinopolyspora halotolerans TaxID=1981512 RepID=A0A6L9S7T3_9ACTN|nr:arginine--tRNA ligase [Phytoactinopolyspora halotolerans]NEE01087.1 arginine--tRNA ligase [Phytoactinopolyspora halotolerans]